MPVWSAKRKLDLRWALIRLKKTEADMPARIQNGTHHWTLDFFWPKRIIKGFCCGIPRHGCQPAHPEPKNGKNWTGSATLDRVGANDEINRPASVNKGHGTGFCVKSAPQLIDSADS